MTPNHLMIYIGPDLEFKKSIEQFVTSQKKKISIESEPFKKGFILEIVSKPELAIVFIDIAGNQSDVEQIMTEVSRVKASPLSKKILFVIMVGNEAETTLTNLAVTSGFQYIFVKGCELQTLFDDCFYIASKQDYPRFGFATARGITAPFATFFLSTLTSTTTKEISIETDYQAIDSVINLNLPYFPDLKMGTFKISQSSSAASIDPMTYSYTLEYPIAGPWDSPSETLLSADTVDTWLLNNKETLFPEFPSILIISKKIQILSKIDPPQVNLSVLDQLGSEAFEKIKLTNPPMIFIDFEDCSSGKNGMLEMEQFFHHLRDQQLSPFIIFTSALSSSSALQKLLSYPRLIATNDPLNLQIFLAITKKFHENKSYISQSEKLCLNRMDSRRILQVQHEIHLNEISEHEMIFTSKIEIPYYSVLYLELPLTMYATIIPPYRHMKTQEGVYRYVALIHGISQENLRFLRQFINQIIYSPLKSYAPPELKKVMDHIYADRTPAKQPQTEEVEIITKETVEKIETEPYKKTIKGLSKL